MKSIDIVLEQSYITLSKAINDPEILAMLSHRGYGIAVLQEGMALCMIARESVQTQDVTRFSKVSATQTFNEIWRVAKIQYHHDVRVARIALKHLQGTRYFLQLENRFPTSFNEWYVQAKEFYASLSNQPELLARVETLGLTVERINQGLEKVQALAAARSQQQALKGNTLSSKRQRNEAIDGFTGWMKTFRQFAHLTFAATPEYLTTLGLEAAPQKPGRKPTLIKSKPPVVAQAQGVAMA